jgi:Tfp pilus assembly protein PilV
MIGKVWHITGVFRHRIGVLARDRHGALLVETMIALTLMTGVGTMLLVGLQTTLRSGAHSESQRIREQIARNQMEAIFNSEFLTPTSTSSYSSITSIDPNHAVSNTTAPYESDANIQRIIVTVQWGTKGELVVETLRSQ